MKAVRVKGFGNVDQLELVELPDSEPQPGQVRIRVKASGLNYADVMQREGLYPGGPKPPFIPGVEAAGIVEAGDSLPAGARVVAIAPNGCHAESVCVYAAACMPIPEAMSFEEAAAFPVQYLTAYHALTTLGRAEPGDTVLVHAAAGGVGTAAIQIAKLLGLRVIGTASSEEKRKRVLELGADDALSYEEFDQKLIGKDPPAVILEAVGGNVFRRSLAILPSLGRLVVYGAASKDVQPIDTLKILFRSQGVLGLHLSAIFERPALLSRSLAVMFEWIAQGKLKMQVGHVLPLAQIAEAHELISSRKSYGKIVLLP
ncbi:MAG TPA: NADPH:quinone oxidoreductase family protein [Pyrinomonadaceae bacterium]|nr:NADPH:quinone oxidoreductase family protein [Pyrinomonadaceae bacterium]